MTTRLMMVATAATLAVVVGCGELDAMQQLGVVNAQQAFAERPCGDGVCNRDKWAVIEAADDLWQLWPYDPRVAGWQPQKVLAVPELPDDFESSGGRVTAIDTRTTDLLTLVLREDRKLFAGTLGANAAAEAIDDAIVGVAWSTAEDRLAVVRANNGVPATLEVLNDQFIVQAEYPLPMQFGDPRPYLPDDVVVSWHPDDSLIAVSYDRFVGVPAGSTGSIVNLASGEVKPHRYTALRFIDATHLCANESEQVVTDGVSSVESYVQVLQRVNGDLIESDRLADYEAVVATDPQSGVFLVATPLIGFPFSRIYYGVRTLESEPEWVYVWGYLPSENFDLLPREAVEGVLVVE
ncbi:MAG: hypothetical protein J5J06_15665 [Phycisphaerae bacterium]|nr:hypothetical protein [Phycisphaerae bacterium]